MRKCGDNNWQVLYHPTVAKKDIPILSSVVAKRIKKVIEEKLVTNPLFYSFPLHGSLQNLFKLRVGDWRVVYSVNNRTVLILVIANRQDVYQVAKRRKC